MPRRERVSRDLRRLALGERHIDYVLVRRRGRRGVGLKVDQTGLTVSAPVTMPLGRVEALVRESQPWVLRKIEEWRSRQVPLVSWEDGAPLPYRGIDLALRTRVGLRPRAELVGAELQVATPAGTDAEIGRAVIAWYKRVARAYLEARMRALAQRAGIEPPRLFLSSAMSRWGSCNSRREVRIAWRLIKAPEAMIDYVICHELAHLRHMNHSKSFWAEVERQCPGFRQLRDALCAADHLYRSF